MEPSSVHDDARRKRANDLYWGSEASVNQIAEEMDLSKGALYNLVRPLPAGLACPRCGVGMEYPNRTARERAFVTCPSCEFEDDEEEVRLEREAAALDSESVAPIVTLAPEGDVHGDGAVGDRPAVSRTLLGTALLGAAAGVALALWARRRT